MGISRETNRRDRLRASFSCASQGRHDDWDHGPPGDYVNSFRLSGYSKSDPFCQDHFPSWLLWTILMQILHVATFGAVGAFKNMVVGFEGLVAGIVGEVGRPDRKLKSQSG
jgi:hypothetical protein